MTRWVDETLHPHFRCSMIADRVLYENRTEHQHLIIFDNATFGRVMMLDGVVQLTTKDEFIYHEMMAHVPLFSLGAERAKRVLVIGGGDGGVMREVLKHKSVERLVLCELDRTVVDLSKEHLPQISQGAFGDPRVEVIIADGVRYVRKLRNASTRSSSTPPSRWGLPRCCSPPRFSRAARVASTSRAC